MSWNTPAAMERRTTMANHSAGNVAPRVPKEIFGGGLYPEGGR